MFDSVTPWTIPCQAPLSLEFSRQEYWSGNPFPSPGGLPNPGTEPGSPTLQADYLVFESPGKPSTSLLQRATGTSLSIVERRPSNHQCKISFKYGTNKPTYKRETDSHKE